MELAWKENRNTQLSTSVILLLSVLLLATFVEAKVLNCRPLPQCCRKYVFSPACRGVAAKRSMPAATKGNDDFFRDPRLFPIDSDYGNENDYGNLIGSFPEEDIRGLSHLLKNPTDEHAEYIN